MPMRQRVFINGFGRIGRTLLHGLLQRPNEFEVVGINDLAGLEVLCHLFKYDSIHPRKLSCKVSDGKLEVDGTVISFFHCNEISNIPYSTMDIDLVFECTGKYKSRDELQEHVRLGARKVILSAPPNEGEDIKTVVLGVNEEIVSSEDCIISNASCTTNSAAHLIQMMRELCDIESAYITTVHSYTGDQTLHDTPHKDFRRARAAAQSIIPTTTGAAKALTRIFPDLDDKIGGCGIRVPVPDGSLTDITFVVKSARTIDDINEAFKQASEGRWKGLLEYTEDPIVSIDVIGNKHSALFDAQLTSVIGKMVKVVAWYDNEVGYSNRLIDLANYWRSV
jgi:glyceraldehyde 3-phosphate dehydrogenase